jgi:molecular chaperone HtpG
MICGIIESYENPWDIVAELTQNSLDSVHKGNPTRGRIVLKVDTPKAEIECVDNGTGINPEEFENLFVPYGTNKRSDSNAIGEKGVGLKFVIFSTNKFRLTSHHEKGSFEVSVDNAADWLRSDGDTEIRFSSERIDNPDSLRGVRVSATLKDDKHEFFDLSEPQLRHLLLTKTAVGSTAHIWTDPENCEVDVTLVDRAGSIHQSILDCRFLLPTSNVKKSISIQEYTDWNSEGDRSDQQKRKKLKDAVIYDKGTIAISGREIKYWSCMVPTRSQWAKFALSEKLIREDEEDDFLKEGHHYYAHNSGVFLSTKYMPTGVKIDLQASGEAGYTENFFIMLEDPSLKFDIGRKGIPPRTTGILRKIAQDQFKKYLKYKRFLRGESETVYSQFERDKLFKEIDSLADLKSGLSKFVKRPNKQEATVAAIFYELMGANRFPGFTPYISGYRDRYDLTGKYDGNNLVLEFKYDLIGLFNDFSSARKMFDEVNVVVVWEITEADQARAKDRGIEIEEIADEQRIFPLTHFRMEIDAVAPVEVLEIKKLISSAS